MKSIYLALLTLTLAEHQLAAQLSYKTRGSTTCVKEVLSPLMLYTNGPGTISPFEDGQMHEVGRTYYMIAIPEPGYAFTSWNPAEVFTLTSIVLDTIPIPGTVITNTNTSVTLSPVPRYTGAQRLRFTMEPVEVLYNNNGNTLTRSYGLQANFVPLITSDLRQRRDPEENLTNAIR
jgi:hypothetical protein